MLSARTGALRVRSESVAYRKSMVTATGALAGKLSVTSTGIGDIISNKNLHNGLKYETY